MVVKVFKVLMVVKEQQALALKAHKACKEFKVLKEFKVQTDLWKEVQTKLFIKIQEMWPPDPPTSHLTEPMRP